MINNPGSKPGYQIKILNYGYFIITDLVCMELRLFVFVGLINLLNSLD